MTRGCLFLGRLPPAILPYEVLVHRLKKMSAGKGFAWLCMALVRRGLILGELKTKLLR